MPTENDVPGPSAARRSKWTLALLMLVAIAAFALLREHWAHVAGYWPYLILLLCPLMHLFGHCSHGGHGGHGGHAGHDQAERK
jgi:hypothetical protein